MQESLLCADGVDLCQGQALYILLVLKSLLRSALAVLHGTGFTDSLGLIPHLSSSRGL